jgi:pyridoxal phosphate enzyme (YggS family)
MCACRANIGRQAMSSLIGRNLARVRERIALAAQRVGRSPSEIALVAVTKTRPPEDLVAAYDAGVRDVGENRVEEAAAKKPQVSLAGLTWHLVGHLQSRKARQAIDLFGVIHSVDSVKLALKLDALAGERGRVMPILLEVNVSGEETKYGLPLADQEALEAAVSEIAALPHLHIDGLMTVAFVAHDPGEVRPVFARLRKLRDELQTRFPQAGWQHLSMGMTDDFPVAVEEGATMLRIGRAIFGPRE